MKHLHQIKYSIWDDLSLDLHLGIPNGKENQRESLGEGRGSRMFSSPEWTKFSSLCSKYLERNHSILGPGDVTVS